MWAAPVAMHKRRMSERMSDREEEEEEEEEEKLLLLLLLYKRNDNKGKEQEEEEEGLNDLLVMLVHVTVWSSSWKGGCGSRSVASE
jgi:hypothetical protein